MSFQRARGRAFDFIALAALVASAIALRAVPLSAQAATKSDWISPFSTVFFSTGTLLVDVTKLNPHFERLDLPQADRPGYFTLSNDAFSIGIGGYAPVLDRVVIGAEWTAADVGEESSPSGKTNAMTTNYFVATVGYAAWTSWRVNIIPALGIGLGSMNLTLKNRDGGPSMSGSPNPTFDEIIESPGSRSVVKGSYLMLQPSIGADFLILRETTSRVGIVLGIRFASPIAPNRTKWKYEGREVFGGPDVGPAGGSLRLIAGIGGFRLGR